MRGFIQGGRAWFYWEGGACVVLFRGGVRGFSSFCGYNEIRSMSGRYASYWNAFLFELFFEEASGNRCCTLFIYLYLYVGEVETDAGTAGWMGIPDAGRLWLINTYIITQFPIHKWRRWMKEKTMVLYSAAEWLNGGVIIAHCCCRPCIGKTWGAVY